MSCSGLRYHVWCTDQEFLFADFLTLRQCACTVEVVQEMPIVHIKQLFINDQPVEQLTNCSTQLYRGERCVNDVWPFSNDVRLSSIRLVVTLELFNHSTDCQVDFVQIEAYAMRSNRPGDLLAGEPLPTSSHVVSVVEKIQVSDCPLPMLSEATIQSRIDLSDMYEQCLGRLDRSASPLEVSQSDLLE
jgi:hypothetical protein